MSMNLIPVDFHSDRLFVIDKDGTPFVPVKPICEALGLARQSQQTKLGSPRWGSMIIMLPSSGGYQDTFCIPLLQVPAWLMSIDAGRVKKEIRAKLIAYQNECDQILWDAWMGRRAAPVESTPTEPVPELSHLQAELLIARPLWKTIRELKTVNRLNHTQIGLVVKREVSTVRGHVRRMEACGLLARATNLPAKAEMAP